MPKIHTTIGLRVSLLFLCEIAVHSVSTSPEACVFVDHKGLNERLTSTQQTPRRTTFRRDVVRRDGFTCVVTHQDGKNCDAAHLIPRGKGNEVSFVVSSYKYFMTLFSSTLQKY